MKDIAQFLLKNYYSKYRLENNTIPTEEILIDSLEMYPKNLIVVRDGEDIKGVAVFVAVSDETFNDIEDKDLGDIQTLVELLNENGDNIHFILAAGSGFANIRTGLRMIEHLNPRSVSWWNPEMTKVHKYNLRRELCRQ